jgi:hypothetical protein
VITHFLLVPTLCLHSPTCIHVVSRDEFNSVLRKGRRNDEAEIFTESRASQESPRISPKSVALPLPKSMSSFTT